MYAIKRFFATVFATVIALVFMVCASAIHTCKFSAIEGERTFYLHSKSSQGLRKQSLSIGDIPYIRGESVRLSPQERLKWGESAQTLVDTLIQTYGATVLLEETACGVTSYYAYTPAWGTGVWVGDKRVNLQIAVSETACTVGSPIIFDGF